MPEQLSPCHRHVDLLDAIGAKNDDDAKQMVNGMRTRLHTALNDAAGAGMPPQPSPEKWAARSCWHGVAKPSRWAARRSGCGQWPWR